ncbi:dsRBD fold-containing protein [Actinocrinis sp.]|uniref:dsRBD fold-containing protein n=1 Tax=Actinocrinis sp. TaxID=1920516 RepID=UPI0032C2498C
MWRRYRSVRTSSTRSSATESPRSKRRPSWRNRAHPRCHPGEGDVPEIGDEIAVGRALVDLGRRLIGTAADELEGVGVRTTGLHS